MVDSALGGRESLAHNSMTECARMLAILLCSQLTVRNSASQSTRVANKLWAVRGYFDKEQMHQIHPAGLVHYILLRVFKCDQIEVLYLLVVR